MTGPLAGYVALDLTDHRGALAGRLLADLGVEVIKIEPPGGDPERARPPWAGDEAGATRSLPWLAENFGKRSVTLDLERAEGRDTLRRLATRADFLLESREPGYLAARGLGWEALSREHPGLILTSITAFGQSGPRADWRASDLTLMAAGGSVFLCGDRDRPPVRIGVPQAWYHAGAEAVVATLIAHHWRERTGAGQWVDVSAQGVIVRTLLSEPGFPLLHDGLFPQRDGPNLPFAGYRRRLIFAARDGHVAFLMAGGAIGEASMRALALWMDAEGEAPAFIRDKSWATWDYAGLKALGPEVAQTEFDAVERVIVAFFGRRSKQDLYEEALKRGVMLAPVAEASDLLESPQLLAREFFVPVGQPGVGRMTVPGPFGKLSRTPLAVDAAPIPGSDTEAVLTRDRPRRSIAADPVPPPAPLAGIRVIDFSWSAAGPVATRYLASFGAEVIRIESARRPDPVRNLGPWKDATPGIDRSYLWANYNAGKLGVTLNLDAEEGRRLARELIRRAHVVTEAFTPGVMARWGLDHATLAREQPDLVMLSTCQQGQSGPHAHYAGYGSMLAGLAGFYGVTGWPDREPALVYGAYTDFIACTLGASALLAALDHRRRTGQGQWIDLSQLEAALQFVAPALLEASVNDRSWPRRGNDDHEACPHGVYPCAGEERWVAVTVDGGAAWRGLARVIGRADWGADAALSGLVGRQARREEIDAAIAAWTRGRTPDGAAAELQGAGVAAAPVATCADLPVDPQLTHTGFFVSVEHPVLGSVPLEGYAFRLPACPPAWQAAPTWGQHNARVFGDVLGLASVEIDRLRQARVIW